MQSELFKFIEKYFILTEAEKSALSEFNLFRSYKKGDILLKEGDLSDESYFIAKGCMRSYFIIDGEEKTTEFYTEGQGFNPLCAITKGPSAHYIDCVEDCIISVGGPDTGGDFLKEFPRFETLCRMISEDLLAHNQLSFATFKTSSPEQRYLHLMETRPDLLQRVPQHQIASYLGMKPESLSRIRKRLQNKGS